MSAFFDIPHQYESSIDLAALSKNTELISVDLNLPESTEFTVAFVDDAAIQKLNQNFREVNSPTDVLSFPVQESNPEDDSDSIGDSVISMDTAARQAQDQQISQINEIYLLMIHGLLHLLGYDHDTEDNKKAMWDVQSRLLQLLNCPADPDRYSL
jgi:probable rRNA maturation factor